MEIYDENNIDINRLREDLINYFSTAINPFDVDLMGTEELNDYSFDQLIDIAIKNGFSMSQYEKEETMLEEES